PRKIDLRLSTVPTSHGERVVFRLLDKSARLYALDELGMPPEVLGEYSETIQAEHGLVLVTGPTGSGKSTTLYGSLQRINCTELNVLTLEDPIEYQLPGVSQMQVSEKKGMSFAKGLRSVLRQDPDIIMVGEIRDRETAELAIQAALTGHLVFSTLHTNDAPSAVTRLLDLGIEPYLVSSSLLAVMAQRLVRRVCGECAEPLDPLDAERELERLRFDMADTWTLKGSSDDHDHGQITGLYRGLGCPACRDTGYRGRVGLYEYLAIDERLRDAIQERSPASRLKQIARRNGMRSLRDDGIQKILRGMTTTDEVLRVTARTAANEASPAERTDIPALGEA
ncbi:MAG: ATPase, T2SS/T4P/T4SS family, partial [Planctomycetota bacterium]